MRTRLIDAPTRKLNRLKKRLPRTGRCWCDRCDRDSVADTEKCSVCGYIRCPRKLHRNEIP
jgi:hypothetical protein